MNIRQFTKYLLVAIAVLVMGFAQAEARTGPETGAAQKATPAQAGKAAAGSEYKVAKRRGRGARRGGFRGRRGFRRRGFRGRRFRGRRHYRHGYGGIYLGLPLYYGYSRYRGGRCSHWARRCAANWGYGNNDFYGCLRYYGCR